MYVTGEKFGGIGTCKREDGEKVKVDGALQVNRGEFEMKDAQTAKVTGQYNSNKHNAHCTYMQWHVAHTEPRSLQKVTGEAGRAAMMADIAARSRPKGDQIGGGEKIRVRVG